MGDKEKVMATRSLATLLTGIVDYAGLFPPAALSMKEAVLQYAHHLKDADAWMLARFVVPVARLDEFIREARSVLPLDSSPWRLSALGSAKFQDDVDLIQEFNKSNPGATIDVIEIKATHVEEVLAAAAVFSGSLNVFVEIPIDKDPSVMLQAIAKAGLHAKVRTGGLTADAFPASSDLARFIATCVNMRIQFKATAGLHHPIRGVHNLTYKPESERGAMYGFLNVFLAAAFVANKLSEAEAEDILNEQSTAAFHFNDEGVTWRSKRLTLTELKNAREHVAASFGSCSFKEPVEDLHALQLL